MLLPFIAALVMIAAAPPAAGATLGDLRWQSRVLILFAPDAGDPALAGQRRELLADEAALAERDLLVFAVPGDTVEPVYGTPPQGESAAALRERFKAPVGFEAVLVGLDGGVKWRSDRPARLADLNAIIDAMPMRRDAR